MICRSKIVLYILMQELLLGRDLLLMVHTLQLLSHWYLLAYQRKLGPSARLDLTPGTQVAMPAFTTISTATHFPEPTAWLAAASAVLHRPDRGKTWWNQSRWRWKGQRLRHCCI